MSRLSELEKELAANEARSTKIRESIAAEEKIMAELQNITEEEKRLAEVLHNIMCHWNHTDGCGWEYDTWDSVLTLNSARATYLIRARKVLVEAKSLGVPEEHVISLFEQVKRW